MPDRILAWLDVVAPNGKLMLAALFATFGTLLGEIPANFGEWENLSLKVILLIAVVWLVRQNLKERAENLIEMGKRTEAIDRQTEAIANLARLTEEQTNYFKSYIRNVMNERLNIKPNLPD